MKKFLILISILLFAGCASVVDLDRIGELEKKVAELEQKPSTEQAGYSFYPFTAFDGGGAGALDKPTGTVDKDVGFLATENIATYGNFFGAYVLDEDGTVGDSLPTSILSADTGEDWELCTLGGNGLLLRSWDTLDPDADAGGMASTLLGSLVFDTDGANATNDMSARWGDGSNQVLAFRKIHDIQVTVVQPNDMDDAVRDHCWFWTNFSGMTFTVTSIYGISDTDDVTLAIYEEDADGQNDALLDNDQNSTTCEIATNGTGMYYMTAVTAIDNPTIETGHHLYIDFDDTDDPGIVKLVISGWFNADVD